MSHELRTPLNSMLILSQSLADNSDGNLKDDEVESATIIYKSGKDLLNLINEVLDLSKIEAGKMDLNNELFDVSIVCDNLFSLFKTTIEEKGVEFITEITPDAPKLINSDQQRIEQVIKNLLSNSVKFTKSGHIKIRFFDASNELDIRRNDLQSKETLGISVSDTGIGISEEKQKLIFEAFQQEDGSTSRKYGGTGLGLSISKELAAILGGELQLQSKQGKGSIFTLILPANSTDLEPNKESVSFEINKVPEKIMISEYQAQNPVEEASFTSFETFLMALSN